MICCVMQIKLLVVAAVVDCSNCLHCKRDRSFFFLSQAAKPQYCFRFESKLDGERGPVTTFFFKEKGENLRRNVLIKAEKNKG